MRCGLITILAGAALTLTSLGVLHAQEPAVAPETEAAETAPAMWRVADADSEFILLGSFHLLPPDHNWRDEAFEAALAEADTVYFEVDVDAPGEQSKAVSVVMLDGFNPDGAMLTDMVAEEDAQKLRDVVRKLELPLAGVNSMRPWNAFLTLTVKFIIQQGYDPNAGVDGVLLAEARTLGKKLAFFETIEEQLALFTELDPETEKELLVLTLRDWDKQVASVDELFDAWATGDVDFIDNLMNGTMREDYPEVYERLIVERNKRWADTLDAALKDGAGDALIVVGVGHLVGGETSAPGLLKAKGYEVSRYGLEDGAESAEEAAPLDAANDNEMEEALSDTIDQTPAEPAAAPANDNASAAASGDIEDRGEEGADTADAGEDGLRVGGDAQN